MSNNREWFLAGMLFGTFVTLSVFLYGAIDNSNRIQKALKPGFEAVGLPADSVPSTDNISKMLNPCVVKGDLPAGCEKYVHDGIVTQPPIKIVLDTSK